MHVCAPSAERLFDLAARALMLTLTGSHVDRPQADTIELHAPSLDLLLVDWLSELLYRFDARSLLVAATRVTLEPHPEGHQLRALVEGEAFDPERHAINVLVKAVTYHGLEVRPADEGWQATVIFDI